VTDAIAALRDFDPLGGRSPAAAGTLRYLLLDVFARKPLRGNPLAVFADGAAPEGEVMQAIARELNLSESVFLSAARDGGEAAARIFTPATELPFAGHPVLGSAVVVALALGREDATLETAGGPVEVRVQERDGLSTLASMSQPLPEWEDFDAGEELLGALSLPSSTLPVEVYCNGPRHVYVGLRDEQQLAALKPDGRALAALGGLGVTCFHADGVRVRSRMFAPGLGVAEDPATGSAAGPLAVHLARHGVVAFGEQVEILQGVEIGRPSQLLARASGSAARLERVEVAGWSVLVGQGALRL
jgi:trans-2,3-dihydro-3-hydroxyanthranilate isomerase